MLFYLFMPKVVFISIKKVLQFGCKVGRGTTALTHTSPTWSDMVRQIVVIPVVLRFLIILILKSIEHNCDDSVLETGQVPAEVQNISNITLCILNKTTLTNIK